MSVGSLKHHVFVYGSSKSFWLPMKERTTQTHANIFRDLWDEEALNHYDPNWNLLPAMFATFTPGKGAFIIGHGCTDCGSRWRIGFHSCGDIRGRLKISNQKYGRKRAISDILCYWVFCNSTDMFGLYSNKFISVWKIHEQTADKLYKSQREMWESCGKKSQRRIYHESSYDLSDSRIEGENPVWLDFCWKCKGIRSWEGGYGPQKYKADGW